MLRKMKIMALKFYFHKFDGSNKKNNSQMKNRIILCLITMLTFLVCTAGEYSDGSIEGQLVENGNSKMTQESLVYNGTTLNYWLYSPANNIESLPLLIYLHGGSGKGDDLNNLLAGGFPKYLYDGDLGNLNAYVIIPQLAKDLVGWSDIAATLRELIIETADKHHCDKSRISITGHSMGGTGTWSIAAKYPELFFRIAPMSGSITNTEANVNALRESTIWAFVGSADVIVNPQSSIDFINALNSNKAKCTVIENATHFDIPQVYVSQEYDITDWLLGQDVSTGINRISVNKDTSKTGYYDLQGRKIANPLHGLYINNWHVIFVK